MSLVKLSMRSATNLTGRRHIIDKATVAKSSGYACTLMPNEPPTSLQITRTACSGRSNCRAYRSCIMCGAWNEWYTVSF